MFVKKWKNLTKVAMTFRSTTMQTFQQLNFFKVCNWNMMKPPKVGLLQKLIGK